MSDDQFTKLFNHMNKRFDDLQTQLETKADRRQVDHLYSLVDQHIKQQEIDEHERLAIGNQLDRHQDWISQLAKHTKAKLAPEP